ncbi:MAG: hypothetical protein KDD78_04830, partial [Caldilineaceae bacterium]|nr:hypothetical protein [Caldilineaceae bacterium]
MRAGPTHVNLSADSAWFTARHLVVCEQSFGDCFHRKQKRRGKPAQTQEAKNMSEIVDIRGREVLDSRGNPTV